MNVAVSHGSCASALLPFVSPHVNVLVIIGGGGALTRKSAFGDGCASVLA